MSTPSETTGGQTASEAVARSASATAGTSNTADALPADGSTGSPAGNGFTPRLTPGSARPAAAQQAGPGAGDRPLLLAAAALLFAVTLAQHQLANAWHAGTDLPDARRALEVVARHGGTLAVDDPTGAVPSLAASSPAQLLFQPAVYAHISSSQLSGSDTPHPGADGLARSPGGASLPAGSGTNAAAGCEHGPTCSHAHPGQGEVTTGHPTGCDHGPACGHAHHAHGGDRDPPLSTGMLLLLQQLGLREMAANLLWIQMDADSHRQLWHRVSFYLELIPAIDPHFVEAFLLRSHVLDRFMNRHEEANRLLEQGIKHNPLNDELLTQLGINNYNRSAGHGATRDLPKALAAFQAACRLPHRPPHVDRFLAYTLAAMDRRDEAIAWLQVQLARPDRADAQKRVDREAIERIRSGEEF